MQNQPVQLPDDWKELLGEEFALPYMNDLRIFLRNEKATGNIIYPPGNLIFNAFSKTALKQLKVVILGQDPYHGAGQAHGLSFSVPAGVRPPPSLQNIFKELQADVGMPIPPTGDLTAWAQQGVLLLNAVLTVRANSPASHQRKGWEQFTDTVIKKISEACPHLVFLLWGKFAQSTAALIDSQKHLILTAAHPSPYSASNGFFGCRHFSKANAFLKQHGLGPVHWDVLNQPL